MPKENAAQDSSRPKPTQKTGSAATFLQLSSDAYRSGQHARAETILRQLTAQRPDIAAAWYLRGVNAAACDNLRQAARCLIEAVRLETARADYCAALAATTVRLGDDGAALEPWRRAVDLCPDNADYRLELGRCLCRLGRHEDALPHLRSAADRQPPARDAMLAYGNALLKTEHAAEAVDVLAAADRNFPDDATILFQLGRAYQRAGDIAAAAESYRRAIAIDTDLVEARINLAGCLRAAGDSRAAVDVGRQALRQRPASVIARSNLGAALCDIGQPEEAVSVLRTALAHDPTNIEAVHNLGVALHASNQAAEAESCFVQCLRRRPHWAAAQRSLANLLREEGRLREAAELYKAVIDARPLDFKSYGNLGLVLLNLNQPQDAAAVYEKALALDPARADIRMSLGIAQLAAGDFDNGWVNYHARLQLTGAAGWRPETGLPTWPGGQHSPVDDTHPTVLVHAEQGFGDTLQFCRYLPLVAATGADIVFECQPALRSLMQSIATRCRDRTVRVIAPSDPAPAADFHVPLLNLPGLFETRLETIPADVPYLAPSPGAATRWAKRLSSRGFSAGLVWSGNPARQDDRQRSCPAEALAPILAVPGVDFYSLQKTPDPAELPSVTDLAPELNDFDDTAAVVDRLDLVISVDTAVAHLAGALAKPVWVMLGFAADWRYLTDRSDSPWYPTMRLFRQPAAGDWNAVATRIASALQALTRTVR